MATTALSLRLDGAPAEDALPHVVHRVATALQQRGERYDGVRVERGCVLLAGTVDSRLVTILVGREPDEGALAMRVLVSERSGAVAAVVAFPVVALGTTILAAQLGDTRAHVGLGALLGAILGVLGAYAAFRLAPRLGAGAAERTRAASSATALVHDLKPGFADLGIRTEERTLQLAGLDGGEVAPAWTRALEAATQSIAEKR